MRVVVLVVVAACSIPPFAGALDDGNLLGHDEDGDGIADADDPCPTISAITDPASKSDADNDGIGDSCDPHPFDMVIGDSKRFYSFAAGHGDLYIDGASSDLTDQLELTATTDSVTTFAWVPNTFSEFRVEMKFGVVSSFGGMDNPEISVATGHPPSTVVGNGVADYCNVRSSSTNLYFDATSTNDPTPTPVNYMTLKGHVKLTQSANGQFTAVLDDLSDAVPSDTVAGVATHKVGQAGLAIHNAIARFDYLFVVGR